MVQPAATLGPLDDAGMCPTCRTTVATTSSCADIVIELHWCAPAHPCHHPMLSHPLSPRALCEALRPAQHLTCSSHARRRSRPRAALWLVRSKSARERVGGAHAAARKRETAQARGTAVLRLVASCAFSMAVQLVVAILCDAVHMFGPPCIWMACMTSVGVQWRRVTCVFTKY